MLTGLVCGHVPWSAVQTGSGHFNHACVGQCCHLGLKTMFLGQENKAEV